MTIEMRKAQMAKVLLPLAIMAIVCVVSSFCFKSAFNIRPVVVDVADPPSSDATMSGYGDGLSSDVVWEKRVLIPERVFESPAEVLHHYEMGLAVQGWIVPDKNLYFNLFEQTCNNAAKLTDDPGNDFSLQVYSTEDELESAPPAPPIQLCLYVKNSVSDGFYEVRLLSIRPSLWDLFNT
jgi:hypothetical protein